MACSIVNCSNLYAIDLKAKTALSAESSNSLTIDTYRICLKHLSQYLTVLVMDTLLYVSPTQHIFQILYSHYLKFLTIHHYAIDFKKSHISDETRNVLRYQKNMPDTFSIYLSWLWSPCYIFLSLSTYIVQYFRYYIPESRPAFST